MQNDRFYEILSRDKVYFQHKDVDTTSASLRLLLTLATTLLTAFLPLTLFAPIVSHDRIALICAAILLLLVAVGALVGLLCVHTTSQVKIRVTEEIQN